MNTYCKIYKLKKGCIDDYKDCHHHISSEQIKTLEKAGANNLEIYMWNEYCIITYECSEFNKFIKNLANSTENSKWQKIVGPMFEEIPVLDGGNLLKPLEKIFSLKDALKSLKGE